MTESKYLHIFNNETKFSKNFFEFLHDNGFDLNQHELFHYGKNDPSYEKFPMRVVFAKYYSVIKHLKLLRSMFKTEKIIVHSLASPWLLLFLFLFPKLTDKVYWVIWGKDLYFYQLLKKKHIHHRIYEFFRKSVFKRIKHVVTYVYGDAELATKWYQINATYHECIMYPSNLFKDIKTTSIPHKGINILLGNSADPSNNHPDLLEKLLPHKNKINKIYAPLSYGDKKHAVKIIKLGHELFDLKFKPLTDFMPFEDYLSIIGSIDVAVFGHNRQQGMGNIITLLSLGKKVFLKRNISSYKMLKELGIHVFDSNKISSETLQAQLKVNNANIIKKSFSKQKLKQQLQKILS